MEEKVIYKRIDFNIIIVLVFLSSFGLMMLYSSCMDMDELKGQAKFMIAGFVLMLACQFLNYAWLKYFATLCYAGAFVLIALLMVPGIGVTEENVTRWIRIGPLQLQVSEPIKLLLIIFFAYYITQHLLEINTIQGVFKIWIMAGIIGFLLLKVSSNLSACLILLMITFCMTFISSSQKKFHILVLSIVLGLVIFIYAFFKINSPSVEQVKKIKEYSYQVARIIAWTDPIKYEDINGYQTVQGLYAIGSGGLFGKGLGKGVQKYKIPKPQNDMIFCVIAEELGLVGALVLIFLYLYLLYYIMIIATGVKDIFGRLICSGVMFNIAFQAFVNIGVATAFLPNTGVTLPFVSAGGSAILLLFAQMAIVLSVYRQDQKRADEKIKRKKKLAKNI